MLVLMQIAASAATLTNRYSFNDAVGSTVAVDSVGGPTWNGIVPSGGTYDGTNLILTAGQFVSLPSGIISNYTAVTIDTWVTFPTAITVNCFFYGFGNQDTNDHLGLNFTGYGYNYIFCAPQAGRIAITDGAWGREQQASGGGNWSGRTVHMTAVYNPPQGCIALYTNGVLVQMNLAETLPMTVVECVSNYIGKSLYSGDPYCDLTLDEFRIWNGALNSLEVAGSDVAGPTAIGTAANAGTVTNIQLSTPLAQMVQGTSQRAKVLGRTDTLSYSVDMTLLCSYSSGNTNVLTVDASNGKITAVGLGSTTVTAQFGSLTNQQTITVIQPATVLTHRYRFNQPDGSLSVTDNVGGLTWYGTLPNGGTFNGSQLSLTAGLYVQLPAGIITNYNALTIETWATFPTALSTAGTITAAWLFGFGDTDGNGDGANFLYLNPGTGHIGIACGDPGDRFDNQAGTYGNLSLQTNIHLSAVFNPAAGWIAVYTNGVLAGKNTNFAYPAAMNTLGSAFGYIAKSLYNAGAFMDVNLDDFRIYNGALSSQGIAVSDRLGADPITIPSTILNFSGALLSLSLQVPASVQILQAAPLRLLATYNGLTNWDIINNSIFPPAGLSITSSDTNVLTYGADGLVHGISPGTATMTVIYQNTTNSAPVTVGNPAAAALAHRYSFSEADGATTTADSMNSGGAWDGTLPDGGTFAGGQLSLAAAFAQYVQLPAGILSNYTAVTIEAWASFGTLPGACFFFGFGDTDGLGVGQNYIFCQPQNGRIAITPASNAGEQGTGGAGNWSGRTNFHVTAVFNPPGNYLALYTNGVMVSITNNVTVPFTSVSNVLSYIGRSLYTADAYMDISLDEFRIYNGVLTPAAVTANQALGPNQLASTVVSLGVSFSGGNLVLSWPSSETGWTLQTKSSLAPSGWSPGPAAQIVGNQWQATILNPSGTAFYRLTK
jgi:Concanavalin A-like lectin/glucanases superfamily